MIECSNGTSFVVGTSPSTVLNAVLTREVRSADLGKLFVSNIFSKWFVSSMFLYCLVTKRSKKWSKTSESFWPPDTPWQACQQNKLIGWVASFGSTQMSVVRDLRLYENRYYKVLISIFFGEHNYFALMLFLMSYHYEIWLFVLMT